MPMLSVDRAADSSEFTEESFLQQGPVVNQLFAERWTEVMPADSPPPNMEEFLKFMALDLKDSRGAMVDTAQEYEIKLGSNKVIRVERKESETELVDRYIDTRTIVDAIYGQERALAMGFSFPRKDVPSRFNRQAEMVLKYFRALPPDEPIAAPKGKEKLALKPQDIIDVLELPYDRLNDNLKSLVTAVRESQTTQALKEESYNKQIERYSTHATCGEMIYRMVGLKKLATQIKPSARRPGQREAVVEPQDDAPAQSADSETPSQEAVLAALNAVTDAGADVAQEDDA